MDDKYQNEVDYQNEEYKNDMVAEKLSHISEMDSAHARTELLTSDQEYENEQEYEYIRFPETRMRQLLEESRRTESDLFAFKADKWRDFRKKTIIMLFVLLLLSWIMMAAALVMAFLRCTEECPLEWHEFEDKCYYISTISLKWEQAQEDCQNRDSELVVINNEMEQNFLIYKINDREKEVWIGLTYRTDEDDWIWVDGTHQAYMSWDYSQPTKVAAKQNYEQHCVVSKTGKWSSFSCKYRCLFVCERSRHVTCVLRSPLLPL